MWFRGAVFLAILRPACAWMLEFYEQQGCSSLDPLASPNPKLASGNDCAEMLIENETIYFQDTRCNPDGTGIPLMTSYRDPSCTIVIDSFDFTAAGDCENLPVTAGVDRGAVKAWCTVTTTTTSTSRGSSSTSLTTTSSSESTTTSSAPTVKPVIPTVVPPAPAPPPPAPTASTSSSSSSESTSSTTTQPAIVPVFPTVGPLTVPTTSGGGGGGVDVHTSTKTWTTTGGPGSSTTWSGPWSWTTTGGGGGATTTTTTEMPWGLPWWAWFLICFGILALLGSCCCFFLLPLGAKRKKDEEEPKDQAFVVVDIPDDVTDDSAYLRERGINVQHTRGMGTLPVEYTDRSGLVLESEPTEATSLLASEPTSKREITDYAL
mmetsp:Transcript_41509/g.97402  ORF Transcript_41509/g.97402 Transcript_41509/m.97402 type:complete len:376 (+) Transcript_41509:200-1327(+)|eukprot:CAMPEP_0178453424 /NCGR_PEP_ID=MMETSP0689_2-20121128/44803_1 /TAXON_ID=160604 /ORGANISM="Amphidinium massartii, Strain CS-259" /LENGTH=375 /DNA_ID=CAMNT_0020079261 /DNA_START=112 /DNA_END=1239 /DNA_ORIENTATION=-